jgi:hypothetical protein
MVNTDSKKKTTTTRGRIHKLSKYKPLERLDTISFLLAGDSEMLVSVFDK